MAQPRFSCSPFPEPDMKCSLYPAFPQAVGPPHSTKPPVFGDEPKHPHPVLR